MRIKSAEDFIHVTIILFITLGLFIYEIYRVPAKSSTSRRTSQKTYVVFSAFRKPDCHSTTNRIESMPENLVIL